jgi:hypothetical protein
MNKVKPENWTPAILSSLVSDVVAALENGEIDFAFDNIEMTGGCLSRSKKTKILPRITLWLVSSRVSMVFLR